MHPDWARSLRDQCEAAGVPFLFKQWGDDSLWIDKQGDVWTPGVDGLMHTPETAPFSREHVERKWGPLKPLRKHAAGRELDGRTWDQYPVLDGAR
jgi:protein gp37